MTPLSPDSCPACGEAAAHPFFDGGMAPLAILGWPRTEQEARAMPRYRLDFVQCIACGHVWNRAFCEDIPYSSQPTLMFNAGILWNRHLAQLADEVLTRLPQSQQWLRLGAAVVTFCAPWLLVGKGSTSDLIPTNQTTSPATSSLRRGFLSRLRICCAFNRIWW